MPMACDAPVRECLAWHIKPKLAPGRIADRHGLAVRGRCPVCDGHDALKISAGEHQRLTWHCFTAGCGDQAGIRAALIRAGIDQGCLPRSRRAPQDDSEAAAAAMQQGTRHSRARTLIRAYLIVLGYQRWPRGDELVKRAGEIDVSRSDAYEARKSGALRGSTPAPSVHRGSAR
jgi:hypothetical protein